MNITNQSRVDVKSTTDESRKLDRHSKSSLKKRPRFNKNRSDAESKHFDVAKENDFAFWNKYPELMDTAARFPWMHIAGTALRGAGINVNFCNVAVQGYYPIPGWQSNATSPLNMAFRKMYLDMHRKYRGIGTYQASDLAITILCIESALQMIIELERVYGILNSIPIKNRIGPFGLLKAMGYSDTLITDIKSHMADFRYTINRLVNLASRLPLPKGMPFMLNHTVLNAFVYTDSKDVRASYLVFMPNSYFEYRTTGDTYCLNGAGTAHLSEGLAYNMRSASTYTAMASIVETNLNKLLYDSDILKITSDFIACYGEDNVEVLKPIPEDYTVIPTYSETILNKWHNSELSEFKPTTMFFENTTYAGSEEGSLYGEFSVFQQNDIIYSMPHYFVGEDPVVGSVPATSLPTITRDAPVMGELSGRAAANTSTRISAQAKSYILDTWLDDPDTECRCESVLWKHNVLEVQGDSGSYCYVFTNLSTELLSTCKLVTITGSDQVATVLFQHTYGNNVSDSSLFGIVKSISQLDWHPLIKLAASNEVVQVFGDVDNVTIVDYSVIAKIIDAALLSAFTADIKFQG